MNLFRFAFTFVALLCLRGIATAQNAFDSNTQLLGQALATRGHVAEHQKRYRAFANQKEFFNFGLNSTQLLNWYLVAAQKRNQNYLDFTESATSPVLEPQAFETYLKNLGLQVEPFTHPALGFCLQINGSEAGSQTQLGKVVKAASRKQRGLKFWYCPEFLEKYGSSGAYQSKEQAILLSHASVMTATTDDTLLHELTHFHIDQLERASASSPFQVAMVRDLTVNEARSLKLESHYLSVFPTEEIVTHALQLHLVNLEALKLSKKIETPGSTLKELWNRRFLGLLRRTSLLSAYGNDLLSALFDPHTHLQLKHAKYKPALDPSTGLAVGVELNLRFEGPDDFIPLTFSILLNETEALKTGQVKSELELVDQGLNKLKKLSLVLQSVQENIEQIEAVAFQELPHFALDTEVHTRLEALTRKLRHFTQIETLKSTRDKSPCSSPKTVLNPLKTLTALTD